MQKLNREDLYTLEKYAAERADFRARIMAHKKNRRVEIGENIALHFEDRLMMQYQVQEVLRAEKVFAAAGIQEELDAYNPLIPDGSNLKASMMIQYGDVAERKRALARMINIENTIWLQAQGHARVYPTADEDLARTTAEKTSAVHFLRFEFSRDMIDSLQAGASLAAGVEHEAINMSIGPLAQNIRDSLVTDFD